MMEGNRLRLVVGKKDNFKQRILNKESSPIGKKERNVSAQFGKKIDYSKSPSPIKGVKKFNVNMNFNGNK